MKRTDRLHTALAVLALLLLWTSCAPRAFAEVQQGSQITLPGAELWQPYIDESPATWEQTAEDPLAVLRSFLPERLWQSVQELLRGYADAMMFLLLAGVISLLAADSFDGALLDLIAAGGCGILLWNDLVDLAQQLCEQIDAWRSFMFGFLSVYAGVLTFSGEGAAGGAASGFLLTALCALAQCVDVCARPLLQSYLALSMACCISTEEGLGVFCTALGRVTTKLIGWAGRLLIALVGLQRVSALQLDRISLQAGKLVVGTVPIIGQSLSDAAETLLASAQMLKSALGAAAILTLAAEFVPLYLGLMIHVGLLSAGALVCGMTGTPRCQKLLGCFAEAVRCMAAMTALFFGLAVFGTSILFVVGGGT